MNCCSGTFSVAQECMLLPECRRSIGYYLDLKYVDSSLLQFAPDFAPQILNKKLRITGDKDVQQADFTLVKAVRGSDLKRRINVLETRIYFAKIQTFPLQTLYHQLTHYMKYSL